MSDGFIFQSTQNLGYKKTTLEGTAVFD